MGSFSVNNLNVILLLKQSHWWAQKTWRTVIYTTLLLIQLCFPSLCGVWRYKLTFKTPWKNIVQVSNK